MRWVVTLLLGVLLLASCTTTRDTAPYQAGALGAAVGAAVGATVDDDNRWRGAVIGGTAGFVLGAGVTEINQRARCQRVVKRVVRNGQVVEETIEEVCP